MHFSDLTVIIANSKAKIFEDRQISHLLTDSRNLTVVPGALFFAISGHSHDGHDFLLQSYHSGIRQFVVEKTEELPADCNILQVKDTITALQQIAIAHRKKFSCPVIGITGSNGKTIVKEWLSALLHKEFRVVKSPKSYNSQVGVPLSVWRMQDHHSLAVFEAGISRVGEMDRLREVIRPDIGIFTNIGTAHAEGFQNEIQKAEEKLKLFRDCEVLIYCKDYQVIDEVVKAEQSIRTISWSLHSSQTDYAVTLKGKMIHLTDFFGRNHSFTPKFYDSASLENLIHCLVAGLYLEVDPKALERAIDDIEAVQMRLTLKEAVNGCYIIDDSYNMDLSALEVALDFLVRQDQRQKKTVIMSDILQSGTDATILYNQVADLLKRKKIDRVIGIGDEIRDLPEMKGIESVFHPSVAELLQSDVSFGNEIILVKGARRYQLEKVVRHLEKKTHGTVLEVNMEALSHNLNFYRSKLSADTRLMVMVKALAYGGSYEIANLLQFHGVDYLGVAYADEGVRLRENGITLPILVLNVTEESFGLLSPYQLQPEIYSMEQLRKFMQFFDGADIPPVHLKLETGMNRLGFAAETIAELVRYLTAHPELPVAGIFTHLAGADSREHRDFSLQQLHLFGELSLRVKEVVKGTPLCHALNTSGITGFPDFHMDMVRLGIGLYGYDPENAKNLKVVSTLKTTVSQIKNVKKGESVGYGRSFYAPDDMKIAIIAIGYADGFRRSLSNGRGKVAINGKLLPVAGKVCMDMTMVAPSDEDVKVGDEVIIFGEDPTIEDLAEWMDTIPYEILTNVGDRVKRIFISE